MKFFSYLLDNKNFKFKNFITNNDILSVKNQKLYISFIKKLSLQFKKKHFGLEGSKKVRVTKKYGIDLNIVYVVSVVFLKSNTFIHISDSKGKLLYSANSGIVNLSGKQRKKRSVSISRLINLMFRKVDFVQNNPVAVHFYNVNYHKLLVIKKLKTIFFIKTIKSFNLIPFNGCRKKKIRRKKFSKPIK